MNLLTRASGGGSSIAVVGIACRLPGARDPEAFWQLLSDGRDAVSELPASRLALAGLSEQDSAWKTDPGTRYGAFLDGVEDFDAGFFGISPREAAAMDPQQRLALELAWEALEDARIAAASVRDQPVGVFLGAIADDYAHLAQRAGADSVDRYTLTGLHRSIIANRISYTLGLSGPSLTVDAGQSASLVAVHLACESLRRGESEMALAGGVHLNLDPLRALSASRFGGLSPDGRCYAFDARANGFVRGEGGGAVLLKPLEKARADGDRIRCVIRGGAVNNDGGGDGLTTPSREAQERVLRQAYRRAGIKRADVRYVELHGTGTAVGDPIEAAALGAVLGAGREAGAELAVGSAKTNVGHLEGAAGIAGLIKAALAVERGRIPASLNFALPNPQIPLDRLGLRVQDQAGEWPDDRPRVAGVSSFGVGGTNCHLVLAGEPIPVNDKKLIKRKEAENRGPIPFVLSAATGEALRGQAARLTAHLEESPDLDPASVAYSLGRTRGALATRAVVLAADRAGQLAGLATLASEGKGPDVIKGAATRPREAAFIFPGQGSQWQGMALELAEQSPVFAGHLADCEAALAPHLDFSLGDVLAGASDAPSIERIEVVQPALFAILVSLARLWMACGVTPAAVAGHSQGEIAAAHVAGGLSLEDAAYLAAVRSRVISKLAEGSGLVSVALAGPPLDSLLESVGGRLEVAAHNGPAATIVAGESEALERLLAHCMADEVRAREVPAAIASHSAFVEPLREELLEALAPIRPRAGEIPFYSTVTGGPLDTRELGPDYWYRNLRETVRLDQVTRRLLEDGRRALIEVSPHPVFSVAIEETVEDALGDPDEALVLGTLHRDRAGWRRFAEALAEAHVGGVAIDWDALFPDAEKVGLPTYAFQRKRHWLDLEPASDDRASARRVVSSDAETEEKAIPTGLLAGVLSELPEVEREGYVLELVRAEVAAALGYESTQEVDATRAFKELGFDSRAAVELRNRLREETGVRLPAAVVFNSPTAVALAAFLHDRALGIEDSETVVAAVSSEEPIAIVGMSCRYPGGASSPQGLWRLVCEGRDAITGFPNDRGWDLEGLYDPDPDSLGTSYAREGGFLPDAADFDHDFFGISPREALAADPQQRLLLEASWEALENSGLDPSALRGTTTGMFAGISAQDYAASQGSPREELDGYRLVGGLGSVVSGRVAYALGLEGPAITIDTACSSSLVTLHLASQALRSGECSLALAGGVTVLSTPTIFTEFARQRGLAPDGRCKAFAESADGVGWSEGVGVLALERLSDAEAKGHRVLAVIRGSAVNQDGASNGLTAPNGPSQERVIRQALANARLQPQDIDAVEAHGTGTMLGDPIEAGALLATYGQERETPLRLGSVKSNIGHSQAAAGVAGVIKTVMAMREGVLPKTLHVDAPSSKVDWEAGEIELLTEATEWKPNGRPRRAGVSSFGISGTNAHLILEEAPAPFAGVPSGVEGPGASSREAPLPGPLPFILSAKTPQALKDSASRLATHIQEHPELEPTDLAHSLITTRAQLSERALIVGSDRAELLEGLAALAQGKPAPNTKTQTAKAGRLAYLLTGQGSQRPGMGKELHETYPAYAKALEEACEQIDQHTDHPLKELIFSQPGSKQAALLERTTYAQPAIFATGLALYRLLESFGLTPDLLTGHSVGEITAAHISGVFSLADAAKLIAARGALMGALPEGGAMLAIEATEPEALEAIEGKDKALSLAAVNGPEAVVISGEEKAIEAQEAHFKAQDRKTKRLAVSHAFHSPLIEPMLEEFAAVLASLTLAEPKLPVISNASGELLSKEQATDPAYWVSHAREPVRFADSIACLVKEGVTAFVEVGPDAALAPMARESLGDVAAAVIPTLRRGRPECQAVVAALGTASAVGIDLDWEAFFAGANPRRVELPTYPFQRERHWLSSAASMGDLSAAGLSDRQHPLLGAAVEDPQGDGLILSGRVSRQGHPWLADHVVFDTVILPGTAFVELALEAAAEVGAAAIAELTLQAPLVLPEQGAVQLRVSVAAVGQTGERPIAIYSRPEGEGGEWTCHGTGALEAAAAAAADRLGAWPPEGAESIEIEHAYEHLAAHGFGYGPAFQRLQAAWKRGSEIFAEVSLAEREAREAGRFSIHPALLDAAFHAGLDLTLGDAIDGGALSLPFTWRGIRVGSGGASSLRVRVLAERDRYSLDGYDSSGALAISIEALIMRAIERRQLSAAARRKSLYRVEWTEVGESEDGATPSLAILGEGDVGALGAERHPDLTSLLAADRIPELVVAVVDPSSFDAPEGVAEAAHALAGWGLKLAQAWLAEEALQDSRLVFLTRGALVAGPEDHPDLAAAPLAGLLRSAQAEHPDRFALIDLGDERDSEKGLVAALGICGEEPQLALRGGRALAARLVEAASAAEVEPPLLETDSTILITGGTGSLGALLARHLAEQGARHLLLVSRRGRHAAGAEELAEELRELGAEVTLASCDVAERDQLELLIDSIPVERPLGTVIHAAGCLDDRVLSALEPQQLREVMRPKIDAAWNLHELTAGLGVSRFVLFSSAAGLLGGPSQGNYAAANAFLDALAVRRQREGLPATSLAWGLWEQQSGMTVGLSEAELAEFRGRVNATLGFVPLSSQRGTELFDASGAMADPLLAPVEFDPAALRARAETGALPPILRALVRVAGPRVAALDPLAARLADLPAGERERELLALVRAHVAAVLGHGAAESIPVERSFKELGFDSLAAVELRNRLNEATGVRLASTLAFDHPSTAALAAFLARQLEGGSHSSRMPRRRASAGDEPIAIVGMSCRYPGGVNSPAELWDLVAEGRDGISEFPADRGWDLERLYHPDPDHTGTSYALSGGFIEDPAGFDAGFFGVSPREALAIDPQQRVLLEACWEACEDANLNPDRLRGSQTGVFAGVMYHDYGVAFPIAGELEGYMTRVSSGSIVAGRVAYSLGLEGPAMSVDTACSSSLVTIHLAAQALRAGECDLALAGGVTVLATPGIFIEFSRQRGLSRDGRCKSFAEEADGTGFGEGVGVLMLERLSEAEAKNHRVLATICGSAVNQDGASNGLTAPNGPSQERVIEHALASAGLEPGDIDAVEAHGTGTALGDPIEAGALLAAYGQERETPLRLGSVKSNIGHTQAAAGVAGVIKTVMAMREGVLPKTLHAEQRSSKVDWEAGAVELLTEPLEWEPNGHPRRAGVSSFGASGTNAHVILEEAPLSTRGSSKGVEDTSLEGAAPASPLPFLLSAKSESALRESAARLASHLRGNPQLELSNVAYSLATARAQMELRAVTVSSEPEELIATLDALAAGGSAPRAHTATARAGRLAYLFTGQGCQRAGMGERLYEISSAYAEALDATCAEINVHIGCSLKELIFSQPGSAEAELLDRTTYAQPALFATEVAIARALESLGLRADLLTGHSVGEIVAAHLAGVFSLPDAARLICARGALMGELPANGAMLAIQATEREALEALQGKDELLSLAAVNSPNAVVISGDAGAIDAEEARWQELGRKSKRLAVSHAFHSPLIEPMLDQFAELVSSLELHPPRLAIVSNLSGALLSAEQATDPGYWVAHARQPVRFADAIATVKSEGAVACVEVGPDAVLAPMTVECLGGEDEMALISTLRAGRPEGEALVRALAKAHASGVQVDWNAFFAGAGAAPVALPSYPFQRKRYWIPAAAGAADPGAIGLSAAEHPFLAAAFEDPRGEGVAFTGRISLQSHPWLADHAAAGTVLLPGTAFVELALWAGREVGCELLEELTLQAPLLLAATGGVALQVRVAGEDERGGWTVSIHSRQEQGEEAGEPWTCHAEGTLSASAPGEGEELSTWPPAGADPIEVGSAYEDFEQLGFDYGPAFQGLTTAWRVGETVCAEVSLAPEQEEEADRFALHPALLDAALHGGLLGPLRGAEGGEGPALPFAWGDVAFFDADAGAARLRVKISPRGENEVSLAIADQRGAPLARIGSLRLRTGVVRQLGGATTRGSLYGLEWQPIERPVGEAAGEVELLSLDELEFERSADPAETAQAAAECVLGRLQGRLLGDEAAEARRLVLLTEGGVAVAGEDPDLIAAAVWGLMRSAQSEYPGRFSAVDSDGSDASRAALSSALAATSVEPQIALREGRLLVPRLAPARGEGIPSRPIDPESTVLISGGTSGIGSLVARHLASTAGARHLLLVSRSGVEAEGVEELCEELRQLGVEVTVAACDVSDRAQLQELIGAIPDEHPLGAVVHSAAILDDGVLEALDGERLERVFAPKARAAWHLHELTAELDVSQFLLFSSTAGLLGGAAQANYAAANAFVDALAAHRRAKGLPATALAWGLWQKGSGAMVNEITEDDRERVMEQIRSRLGFAPMSSTQGLALFDAARGLDQSLLAPVRFDKASLRAQVAQGTLPALLRGLVQAPGRRSEQQGRLAERMAGMGEEERADLVLDLVRSIAASVLGHDSAAQVHPERAFKELGFDSLAAVELRNRLSAETDLRLPATVVFDYPSVQELAGYVLGEIGAGDVERAPAVRAQSSEEPIAIIGMSCRYPGGASSPQGLWRLVCEGRDAITGFPNDRGWDLEGLYDPDPDSLGTSYAREGGFLPDAADFDATFFGISPNETLATDPQQRLLLEASWEALEDAGVDPGALRETSAGVFAGVMYSDYGTGAAPTNEIEGHRGAGVAGSVVSGRVAYALALEGPAITIDTACSSSLVTLHLAAQALRSGECSLALAGGVTVLSTPTIFTEFARQRGLAPDGRCKAFAESADGVGWSEGVGVLALERLSDAEAKGHRVLAVIRGSAVNQDGASNGLTAPNGPSQERVIRQALANARLQPQDIDAVEAHGTGTMLGDPIEAGALLATYGQERETPLRLGSVKSNIGHSQAAAGVAGVIKTVMAMREGVLPKTLHVDAPSSKVDWEAGEIELLTEATEWKPNGRPRRAGVSSFGISGTNAHLILEEAPAPFAGVPSGVEGPGASSREAPLPGPLPFILSAKTPQALKDSASRLATHIQEHPELEPTDLAHSLLTTRAQLPERALIIGSDRAELLEGLAALAQGKPAPNTKTQTAKAGRLAYLLTGQGSQRPGMGKELYETYPAYAKALEEACEQIDQHTDHPLRELIFSQPGSKQAALLERTTYAQPAIFATGLALYRLLESFGLTPDLLTGHSVGEITAAHISGVFSLTDAAKLIAARGALMGALPEGGAMLAIEATEPEALEAIEGKEEELSLAAVNGPEAVVISGEEKAIEAQEAHFKAQDRKTKRLAVSHAFHSPLIEPMLEDFKAVLASLTLAEPKLPVISNASGELLSKEQATDPAYWVSHAREPVRFAKGIETLREQGTTTYLELGADPLLGPMASTVLQEGSTPIPTLRQGRDEPEALIFALAAAHAAGAKPDWSAFFAGTGAKAVPLPTYPFQRKRYWLNPSSGSGDPSAIGQVDADHPLLSATIEDPATEGLTLTGRISIQTHPWLADHAAAGTVLLPGTAFVEMALRAGREAGCELLQELALQAPLILPEQGAVALQVKLGAEGEGGEREVSIYSRPESSEAEQPQWTLHALGTLTSQAPQAKEPLTQWPPEGAEPIELDSVYERLAEAGFDYGPAFQGLERAWRAGGEVYAEVSLAEEQRAEAQRFGVHPALLDSSLHAALDLLMEERGRQGRPILPFAWKQIAIDSPGQSSLRARLRTEGESFVIDTFDQDGAPACSVGAVIGREVDPKALGSASSSPFYLLQWQKTSPEQIPAEQTPTQLLSPQDLDFEPSGDPVKDTHAATQSALTYIQAWLADGEREAERLILLTEGAIATAKDQEPDLPSAALWGLIRSAASEHPGRFAAIDSDATKESKAALKDALALSEAEPQIALREGTLLVPRLKAAAQEQEPTEPIDPGKSVLITGGLSGIGALVARHLVQAHGARHLLLASRRGNESEGAKELIEELESLGAQVEVGACDVSDPKQLRKLIGKVDPEHPLGAVIHSAGLLDDGVIEALTPERLERVLAPKVDGAWHLHELTKELGISQFLLFSSAAGLLGGAAQANYSAANAFLDALAQKRQSEGLPATALAWGLWGQMSQGMAREIDEAGAKRMIEQIRTRLGFAPMSPEQGLALFDAARAQAEPITAPAPIDRAALRAQAKQGTLPALLRGLVKATASRQRAQGSLAQRLAQTPEAEHEALVLELVRGTAASVLGHDSAAQVEPERAFKELGFDSLAAVELRNRLGAEIDLRLPATVVFDYPSVRELAGYVLGEIGAGNVERAPAVRAQSSEEPIAIVGMSCRFPGNASSPQELWQLVSEGRDAIGEFPADRGWDLERLYDPDPDSVGASYTRHGGFLPDVADFDPAFFDISPRDALALDPQQRLLLEISWGALEDAGVDPLSLRGSPTGVFAGLMYQDYGTAAEIAPGMSGSVVTGRVAYSLGLEGPTMTVDTACSSSLVAMHLASQALRAGECSLALAGGVTVFSTPWVLTYFSRLRGLSSDGRCKSFAEGADGAGFAEGVGMVALERLSDAEAKGHRILAVIRGSAVNQDGASNGLTAPNGPSQERVIRQALANARLQPQDIDAVEAHGTGTMLGDPIEAGALLATYGQERETPLRLGSVKSNIGHSQAAAGVAGVIKTVMAMREGVLPKTLHVDAPSSKVDWEAGEIELLTEATEWKPNGHPRRAGVSSFGASGTNAHLILEEAPMSGRDPGPGASAKDAPAAEASLAGPLPFILSAKTPQALKDSASRLATHIQEHPELEPTDLAHSLITTRAQLSERALIVGSDRDELLEGLAALAQGKPAPNTKTQTAKAGRLAYLLTGQGSQRPGMGKELHETYPAYAKALEEACEQIDQHTDHPLKELIFSQPGSKQAALLERTTYAQPALFATGLALYRLLESFGLTPDLLTGHSVGEITAAHISGVFSLADAAKLIAARGALMGALPEGGAMLAIEATEPEALEAIEGKDKALSLAAVNGPEAVVISGEEKAIEAQEAHFKAQDRKTKRLAVSHAFHSPLIEPMLEDFKAVLASLTLAEPKLPVISNASGELLSKEQATDPAYWVSHAREPVRFAKGIETLAEQGTTTYLELGADPLLGPMASTVLQEGSTPIPTLRQGRDEPEALIFALAAAHAAGAKPDWSAFFAGTGAKAVPLPTYPFQRKRYWLNPSSGSGDPSAIGQVDADHPLLSATIEDPATEGLTLTGRISIQTHPWLADHAAAGTVLLPGTAFVEMALRAGREAGCELLQELALQAPLILPEQGAVALQVKLGAEGEGGEREVSIYSRPESSEAEQPQWTLHALGTLTSQAPQAKEPLTQWPPEGAEPIELDSVYERLAEAGFDYGPAFQGLERAWRAGGEVYAEVSLAEEQRAEAQRFGVHPALLDSSLHAALDLLMEERGRQGRPILPFAWKQIAIDSPGQSSLRARLRTEGESFVIDTFDQDGAPACSVGAVIGREVDPKALGSASSSPFYLLQWQKTSPEQIPAEQTPTQLLSPQDLDFEPSGDPVKDTHAATQSALTYIQAWLADGEREAERLILLTEGAIATAKDQEPDLPSAALWGLIRSAASEHPGRFAAIDSDATKESKAALKDALALSEAEPQIALREGTLLVPRLKAAAQEQEPTEPIDPGKSVLITGGLSGIGALVARHLVQAHGARHLLLASRRGNESEGAKELIEELESLGAQVEVGACDVSDPKQLRKLIGKVDPEHPLGAVIHSAGLLDDGVIEALTPERLERVLAPKVDGAWHLHELTKELGISQFLLFSSIGGAFGGAAQANYSAANAFLDALAQKRRAQGLPAISMAWGRWQSGMAANLDAADTTRLENAGLAALSREQGLSLFDLALGAEGAHVLPARLNFAALRAQARAGTLPAALRDLVRVPQRQRQAQDSLAERLAGMPEAEHDAYVLELVRTHTAAVLGHSSPLDVAPERAFQEQGFDSLAAVELRNRLGAATGLRLPATVVFDYPSAGDLAAYVLVRVGGEEKVKRADSPDDSPVEEESELIAQIDEMDIDDLVERTLAKQGAVEGGGTK